jgi:hypothetical protein
MEKLVKGQYDIAEIESDKQAAPFSPILFHLKLNFFCLKKNFLNIVFKKS